MPGTLRCFVFIVVAGGLGFLHGLHGCATAKAETLRIMPLGDSITAGYTDNPNWNVPFEFGYRSGLYTRLTDAGYDFEFVGASQEPYNNAFGDPSKGDTVNPALDLRPLGQDGHRGYGGESIGGTTSKVEAYLAADDPDIILLMIGINGIGPGSPAALEALLDTIVAHKPEAHIIVAQITPLASFNQSLLDYNTYIRETLVPNRRAAGENVSTVDQYGNFLTDPNDATSIDATRFSNGINHPSNSAYESMAETWLNGIQAVAPAPEPAGD